MPAPNAAAGLGDAIVSAVLQVVQAGKLDELVIDDLEMQDLKRISWSGSPAHLRSVAVALARVAGGEVEYLAVRAPGGEPVAKGGIDYIANENGGTFWQLATATRLQGVGLGTRLILEGERRIRRRGLDWAMIAVEDNNPRARALYERLGYKPWRRERAWWQEEDEHGHLHRYETEVNLLRKRLYSPLVGEPHLTN